MRDISTDHPLSPVDTKPNLGQDNADEWGEFLHLPNQKFHDFNKIREEIVKDTEKMTGKNAGELYEVLKCQLEAEPRSLVSTRYLPSTH
jgi:hypothetical protein